MITRSANSRHFERGVARRVMRLGATCAVALALATACAPDPGTGTNSGPVIVNYGGQAFDYRGDVPYAGTYAETKYDVWLPVAGAPARPLVVFIHGGFWATQDGANRKNLPTTIKDLLLHGFAVASIDYRGVLQTCAGGTPCSQEAILGDVKTAIGDLVYNGALGRVTDELHLIGYSAGGHLALMAAMTYQSPDHPTGPFEVKPDTVTSIAGPTDLAEIWNANSAGPFGRSAVERYAGTYGYAPDNNRVSPIAQTGRDFLNRVDPPINLIYSTTDELVPYAQATAFQSAASLAGISVTLQTVTGSAHGAMADSVNTNALAVWLDAH